MSTAIASAQLKRVNEAVNSVSTNKVCPLEIRRFGIIDFLGPWHELSKMLRFGNTSSNRLRASTPPKTVSPQDANDSFVGLSAVGLVALCAKTGHSLDLLLAAAEQNGFQCFYRAFCRWLLEPHTSPTHPLLKSVRCFALEPEPGFCELDLLSLFGISKLDHAGRSVYEGVSAVHRRLYDLNKSALVPAGKNSSSSKVWVLSPAAARHCLKFLLETTRLRLDGSKADPPIAAAMHAAASALFQQTAIWRDAVRARREWAAELCRSAALQLSLLTPEERADPALDVPLQCLSDTLGTIARQRAAPIASEMVAQQHSLLGPLSIVHTDHKQYLEAHSEPVTRAFLSAAMGTHTARRAGLCPDPVADEKRELKAQTALVTVSDAVMHAVNPKVHPPLINAIAQDIGTVSSMPCCCCCCGFVCHVRLFVCLFVLFSCVVCLFFCSSRGLCA